jgi:hypothetical protein
MNLTPSATDINPAKDAKSADGKMLGAVALKRDKLENSRASAINIIAIVYKLTRPTVDGVYASLD